MAMKEYLLMLVLLTIISLVLKSQIGKMKIKELKNTQKYIQFQCTSSDVCGGWADRLKGLLSTYAFSLIANRKFLIKMTKNCDLKNVLEPNEVNWDFSQLSKKNSISSKVVDYNWNFGLNGKFKKEKNLSDLTNHSLISIKGAFMFSDPLSENPNFKKTITELGYNQSEFKIAYLLRKLYKKLFKLNKRLQVKHDLFLKKLKPSNKTKVICAQVRMGDPGHVGQADQNASMSFWYFINNTFLSASENYSIFVTADREEVKLEAKHFFKFQNVVYNEQSSYHVEKKSESCDGLENVIFDFHLMQHCDIGVVSHSGFGIMSMWNRPDPFKDLYVYTKENQTAFKKSYWNRKKLTFLRYNNLSSIYFT